MKVEVSLEVDEGRIKDLLVSALEGGANYWYRVDGFLNKKPKQETPYFPSYITTPMSEDGALWIMDDWEGPGELKEPFKLDRLAIVNGLKKMAEKHPKHFADFISENDDATTGDVFLQMCVFGEVVYG